MSGNEYDIQGQIVSKDEHHVPSLVAANAYTGTGHHPAGTGPNVIPATAPGLGNSGIMKTTVVTAAKNPLESSKEANDAAMGSSEKSDTGKYAPFDI